MMKNAVTVETFCEDKTKDELQTIIDSLNAQLNEFTSSTIGSTIDSVDEYNRTVIDRDGYRARLERLL